MTSTRAKVKDIGKGTLDVLDVSSNISYINECVGGLALTMKRSTNLSATSSRT